MLHSHLLRQPAGVPFERPAQRVDVSAPVTPNPQPPCATDFQECSEVDGKGSEVDGKGSEVDGKGS